MWWATGTQLVILTVTVGTRPQTMPVQAGVFPSRDAGRTTSGIGKSTLAALLAGIVAPTTGAVSLVLQL
ncbi:hypothetical protein ACIO7M_10405 [Streptomyces toxytricini]|uniref:Secreted protein n=1 Tax=Streptomyces toxytricini TaxID=67369 RepID=A0ABW8EE72_STRT5